MNTQAAKFADLAERAIWTLLQAGVGESVVLAIDGPQWLVAPIAALLAIVKGALAQRFGNGTAATLPAEIEPVPAPAPADAPVAPAADAEPPPE